MKRLIFLFGFVLAACKKTEIVAYESNGTISGYDYAACAMCGGLKIVIKNDTTKNALSFYRINKTLTQLGISESTSFPVYVRLSWQHDTNLIGGNYIFVSNIKVIN